MTNIAQTIELRRDYEDRVIKAHEKRRRAETNMAQAEMHFLAAQAEVEHAEATLRTLLKEEADWLVAGPVVQSTQASETADDEAVK